MKQAPDRKKLRREYVKQRSKAYSLIAIVCLAAVPVIWIGLQRTKDFLEVTGIPSGIVILEACLMLVALLWFVIQTANQVHREVKQLPYVPPVTPNTLPADEILVRGSEEPTIAQSEVLLRAAKEVETRKDELLRGTQA